MNRPLPSQPILQHMRQHLRKLFEEAAPWFGRGWQIQFSYNVMAGDGSSAFNLSGSTDHHLRNSTNAQLAVMSVNAMPTLLDLLDQQEQEIVVLNQKMDALRQERDELLRTPSLAERMADDPDLEDRILAAIKRGAEIRAAAEPAVRPGRRR